MGKPVIRLGPDKSLGHSPCFPPVPATMGSNNVRVNKMPVVRMGDPYKLHCCSGSCHVGKATGSSRVFANKKGVTRLGDKITCGDTSGGGSSNVSAG